MMARDPRIALDDMIAAIDRIAEETTASAFEQFALTDRGSNSGPNVQRGPKTRIGICCRAAGGE